MLFWHNIMVKAGYLLLFINCLLFLKGFSKSEKPFKILTLYNLAMFAVQMISYSVAHFYHANNLFLSHFYFIPQFILLSLFYFTIFENKKQKLIVKIVLPIVIIVLAIQYMLDFKEFYSFNKLEIVITSIPIVVYATFNLYNMLNGIRKYYYFNLGILIYLFGSTIVFLTSELMISKAREYQLIIWELNVYLYVVYQLFIMYELRNYYLNKNI
jgi:hypothetical protein